jgi:uncharacterized protein YjbI with pentapeptide repeats
LDFARSAVEFASTNPSEENGEHPMAEQTQTFTNADLTAASFSNVRLTCVRFDDVDMSCANIYNTDLSAARFDDVNLRGATLRNVNLGSVRIDDCDVQGLTIDGFDIARLISEERARRQTAVIR